MTDYGHELQFGVFITPDSARPHDTVALALLSERAGLDLVTFQDHPYQPAFLDTWTLLSWVAAQTERVKLSANVINLPLRPPTVLARAAASLDLLSEGRVELALGAGAFWDAIAAMGGPHLTPGQSVAALEEAIDIIRAIWSTAERRGVNLNGEHYHVQGAKRGPEPAHDIAIWLGAAKPRMLSLVGRKADGWLPSLRFLGLDGLERGNATIDAAAQNFGRDPREIRRLVNIDGAFTTTASGGDFLHGPPDQWVQQLLPLVIERGFSTFILASDDPREIEVYASEVAPGLRLAAAAERGAAPPHQAI
jgi:alkanesulfonate monooxygenase SsuD/methylene tetrahydromethanopterin reductase-like flavin-dependent oxidoreductase (luciferase family)